MSAEVKRKYSREEYLALERGSDVRYVGLTHSSIFNAETL